MRIPAEFEVVGLGLRGANGKRMYLFVQGNLSGWQEAGRISGQLYDGFMRAMCGFEASAVDRRLYYHFRPTGGALQLAVLTHVDDNLIRVQNRTAYEKSMEQWKKAFWEGVAARGAIQDFTGLRLERSDNGSYEISGPRMHTDLLTMLDAAYAHPRSPSRLGINAGVPLPAGALEKVRALPSPGNERLGEDAHGAARGILGLCWFMACHFRPDSHFSYIVLSQQIGHNFTTYVFKCVLQLEWLTQVGG